jgi:succinyl-CoA synthetase beta subunit
MKLYEHEAKKAFEKLGLTLPTQYGTITSPEQLDGLGIEFPVMLKSMVLVGGRGKAGGIKKVNSMEEAKQVASDLFNLTIKDYPVELLLVEAARDFTGQCYIGVTMDPDTYNNILMISAEGGVDIEEVARTHPDAIKKIFIPGNQMELPSDVRKEAGDFLAVGLGVDDAMAEKLADAVNNVYMTYQNFDCKVCEVNPMLLTAQGPVAVDAKIVLDDNALYRQSELLKVLGIKGKRHDVSEPTANEVRAYKAGFPYVDLLPEDFVKEPGILYVGLVPGGAGYGIFSIDEVANVGDRFFDSKVVPVNFMDSGGGPKQGKIAEMFHLLMDYDVVDMIITSRFGGISSCDVFIRGLVQAVQERHEQGKRMVPIYGRMVGTDLPGANKYLINAKKEMPEILKDVHIIVGNQKIMVDTIKDGFTEFFKSRGDA